MGISASFSPPSPPEYGRIIPALFKVILLGLPHIFDPSLLSRPLLPEYRPSCSPAGFSFLFYPFLFCPTGFISKKTPAISSLRFLY